MRKGIYILPNLLTLTSMFLGFYSIVRSFNADYELAAWAIMAAAIFDVLDGWVARITHTATRFGIEIDSLSDVISFGVAPGILVYTWTLESFGKIGWLGSFFLVACAALRLARFNVQMGGAEKKHFTGLPTPAAALVIATTVVAYEEVSRILSSSELIWLANAVVTGLLGAGADVPAGRPHGQQYHLSQPERGELEAAAAVRDTGRHRGVPGNSCVSPVARPVPGFHLVRG